MNRESAVLRGAGLALTTLVGLSNGWSAVLLVLDLVTGGPSSPAELLTAGAAVWLINMLAFALAYWELDRGGPAGRAAGRRARPDFLFVQIGGRARGDRASRSARGQRAALTSSLPASIPASSSRDQGIPASDNRTHDLTRFRGRVGRPELMPITWEEVEGRRTPGDLGFMAVDVLARVGIWRPLRPPLHEEVRSALTFGEAAVAGPSRRC